MYHSKHCKEKGFEPKVETYVQSIAFRKNLESFSSEKNSRSDLFINPDLKMFELSHGIINWKHQQSQSYHCEYLASLKIFYHKKH